MFSIRRIIASVSSRYSTTSIVIRNNYSHRQIHEAKLCDSEATIALRINDETFKYPSIWLRDNCQCSKCFHNGSHSRIINWENFDFGAKPLSVKFEGSKLGIEWSDDHKSIFDIDWLKERRFTEEKRKLFRDQIYRFKKVTWGSKEFLNCSKKFDYRTVLNEDSVLLDWLESLSKYGFAFITNVPAARDSNKKLVERVAFVKRTYYGEEFVVRAKEGTTNTAYLSANLQLHTDLPYYNYKPGINSLHCLVQSQGEGGDSRLVDAFNVGNYMRLNHPDEYKILTKTLVDWNDIGNEDGYEFHSLYQAPVLCQDELGELIRVNFSQAQRDSHFNSPLEQITPWYKAVGLFSKLLYSPENSVTFKLAEGEILVFDNLRLVHGRTAYVDQAGKERMLIGCYLDWDETNSRMRVLRKNLKREDINFS